MKKIVFNSNLAVCVLLLLFASTAYAEIDMDIFAGMKARSIGPANMSGRISSIEAVRDNRNVIYVGTATGPAAPSARLRLIGEAGLRAVEDIIGDQALALDAIGSPGIGMRKVIVSVVVSTGPQGEEVVVGSALSQGDDSETAVRSVLDALNRRIGRPD